MVTEREELSGHETALTTIGNALSSSSWEERLAIVELVEGLLSDLPSEKTVERLVKVLDHLANDTKWEIRRAVVSVLVSARRPGAAAVIERLTNDDNQWVRQAAHRAKRKLSRDTTIADKQDKKSRFAFETIKDLEGASNPRVYQAAIRIGEKYYEELAGDTAHELNTYRASMEGLLEELEIRIGGDHRAAVEINEILQKIRSRSKYLKALVTGLIEYSKDVELRFEVTQLQPVIAEAIELAREKSGVGRSGNDIEAVVAISPDIHAELCRVRFLQAVTNIVSNAFEALGGRPSPRRVAIDAQADGGQTLSLTIRDTGVGMDAAQLNSATKRFRSLRKDKGGIGLGLPLAVKIIEREHKGRVDLESTVGVGTSVTIEIPLKREA